MRDKDKTKGQLIDELVGLRQRIGELGQLDQKLLEALDGLSGSGGIYHSLYSLFICHAYESS